jgi:DNA (cytosine-5)-methyltransferase 1
MKFGSVCSGIEAASVAFAPLGWHAAWFSEIEPFPSATLAHHYPNTPNLGDMTTLPERITSGEVEAPDMLCGGTPCQAFSVAGLRKSLDDERGNLSLVFCEIANAIDNTRSLFGLPESIIFWENVPGVLSTSDNAFGCFLAGLAGESDPLIAPGGKWANAGCVFGPQRTVAWRILDAQYFGVAQRRRRVFVIASAREGFDPAAVLFEFDGLRRDTAPSREAREEVTPTIRAGAGNGGAAGCEFGPSGGRFVDVNPTLDARAKDGPIRNQLAGAVIQPYTVANCLTQRMYKGINTTLDEGQTPVLAMRESGPSMGAKNPTAVAYALQHAQIGRKDSAGPQGKGWQEEVAFTQDSRSCADAVAVVLPINTQLATRHNRLGDSTGFGIGEDTDPAFTLTKAHSHAVAFAPAEVGPTIGSSGPPYSRTGMQVRRLTPKECERLQGFPDGYTRIPNWSGWRALDENETPEQCRAEGLEVKQNKKTGKWRVKDVDGPRYKALGNSWAVPVVKWIGTRIKEQLEVA